LSILWSRKAFILYAGLAFGVLSAFLVKWGNPLNMGFCNLCFVRDIAGAIKLHTAAAVQYLRPEILGLGLGAVVASLGFREFRARGGASPLVRFFLGVFIAIGALVFLGCPWRLILRLGGGDLGAIFGLIGLLTGVSVGVFLLKKGFNLGRATRTFTVAGWIMPVVFIGLLLLAIFTPSFIAASVKPETGATPVGAMHPALWISLAAGLFIGFIAQRTRFCTMGGWRDLLLVKDNYLFMGLLGLFLGVLITNYALGFFGGTLHWGFLKEPVALPGVDATGAVRWTDFLWAGLGMGLVGLAAVLAGGCPLRQVIMSGEGDTDAGVTVLGMLVGAAIAMNFLLASSGAGPGKYGPVAVIICLVACLALGFGMREKT
jgi:uncharacterized protein